MTQEQPPLPGVFSPFDDETPHFIDRQTIDRWIAIKVTDYVAVKLTRLDLDHLFYFATQMGASLSEFQNAMISYSNGDIDSANASLQKSQRLQRTSETNFRKFFASVMRGAEVAEDSR